MSPRRLNSPEYGYRGPARAISFLFMLLFIFSYNTFYRFWGNLTLQEKWIFGILSVIILTLAISMIAVFIEYRKWKRAEAWRKAMKTWNQNVRSRKVPNYSSADTLTPEGLEKLAMQVYEMMGYRVNPTGQTGDHGVDVRLVRPSGEVVLVQCKQWHKPVGEAEVRNLMELIVREKAVKGYLWAPNGFSISAILWVIGKPILLMDNGVIGRLVERVYSN